MVNILIIMNIHHMRLVVKRSRILNIKCNMETSQMLNKTCFVFFFPDEVDIDNEISREIDEMLENIQNSL